MQFTGYVADIEDDVDAVALDYETIDYYETDAALVSEERIRLEWTEGDMFCAVTIDQIIENEDGEIGSGKIERTFFSRKDRRNVQRRELGRITAMVISNDAEDDIEYYELSEFWLDVKWTTDQESGRFLFELQSQDDDS